jgi:uncharacterized coiled-coil DUF342 family protein
MLLDPVLKGKLQKIHDLIKDSQPPVGNIAEVVKLREAMKGEVNALHKSLLTKLEKVMEVSESSHPELQRVRGLTDALTTAIQEMQGGPGDNPGVGD